MVSHQDFDALVVAPFCQGSPIDELDSADEGDEKANIKRVLEKWLFLGDDRNLDQVFVRGSPVLPFAQ